MALRSPLAYTEYQHETPTRPLSLSPAAFSLSLAHSLACALLNCARAPTVMELTVHVRRGAHTHSVYRRERQRAFHANLKILHI